MTVTGIAVRYGTDLGRLDPNCTARRHGTYSAYGAGCRCPHAREAHRVYQKRHREGRAEHLLVDATGTRRRIQALWAIGHSSQAISDATGGKYSRPHIQLIPGRSMVSTFTRDAIAQVYRVLAGSPGSSVKTRARAAAAGYPSPMRWGPDIDDPVAVPEPEVLDVGVGDHLDEVAVERALAGDRVDLTDAELVAVLQAGVARGESLAKLAARLGVNYFGARKMLGGELTPTRAKQQRVEAALAESWHLPDSHLGVLLGVHPQTVTRARLRLARRRGRVAS